MKHKLYPFQKEWAEAIANKMWNSHVIFIQFPCGIGKRHIVKEVGRLLSLKKYSLDKPKRVK